MTISPSDLVTAFCAEWKAGDAASIAAYFSEDAVYHNIPMEPLCGRAAITDFLHGFISTFGGIEFTIHHQASNGTVVLNERTDRFTLGDKHVELPVMGVFEVEAGEIISWRDYFDMSPIATLLSAG